MQYTIRFHNILDFRIAYRFKVKNFKLWSGLSEFYDMAKHLLFYSLIFIVISILLLVNYWLI